MLKRHQCRAPAGIAFEDSVKMHPVRRCAAVLASLNTTTTQGRGVGSGLEPGDRAAIGKLLVRIVQKQGHGQDVHRWLHLKTEDSAGEILVDPEVTTIPQVQNRPLSAKLLRLREISIPLGLVACVQHFPWTLR